MKNYASLGNVLSKEQAQNVNGGVSVICNSTNGASVCRIGCSNGNSIVITGCSSARASSVNGVERVVACGKVYHC